MSTSITTKTKSEELHDDKNDKTSRYQQLAQKKSSLEKKLNEKYEQLHQLCQKEANLIGNNLDLIIPNTSGNSSSHQQQVAVPQYRNSNKTNNSNNYHQNELNRLLVERQKQQQLSQTSLGIINDPMQSKSIRRTHRQAYDMSQQKIDQLNENISTLQRNDMISMKTQDDIDLHRSDNRFMNNALAMCGNNARNLHMLNTANSLLMSERRNSMKSTTSSLGSSNTFIHIQSPPSSATSLTSLKTLPNNPMAHSPRTRQDGRYEFEIHKGSESPTPSSTMSMQHPPTVQMTHQLPLCSQSLKNIKINTENHSPNVQSYHLHSQYSPQLQSQPQHSPQFFNVQNSQAFIFQQQHTLPSPARQQQQQIQPNEHKFIQRLHSFNHQMQNDKNYLMSSSDGRVKQIPKYQASPNHYTVSHTAGLGGYWTVNEHNQRVWVSESKYPLSPPNQNNNMAKKSNSLGNFDFIHQSDDNLQPDAVSVSSGNSNEHKKKEKIWCETSLDSPTERRRMKPKVESPTPSSYSAADFINNNHHQIYENTPPTSKPLPRHLQHQSQYNSNSSINSNTIDTNTLRSQQHQCENGYYHNPLANVPSLPPKSKLRYSESTRSTMSNRDFENNLMNTINSPLTQHIQSPLQVESPLNVTIIQEGSWKPYKEEIKSYEISDFYKYSEKYRQQHQQQQNN